MWVDYANKINDDNESSDRFVDKVLFTENYIHFYENCNFILSN